MKVFVTSNQQFGRKGAIKTYKRPFIDVDDMNMQLISAWNSVVSDEDTVYVLGNFAWDPETLEVIINALNGNIIIVAGEHDKATHEVIEMELNVDIDYLYNAIEEYPEANVVMSYWPLTEWPGKQNGTYSIIGYPDKKYKTNHRTRVINCACDIWDFKPIEIVKLVSLLNEANT